MDKRTKAKSKTKIGIILSVLVLLFLSGCANQLPPGGGEIDKIPPEIEEFYPPNGTTNFKDDYISFDFSEYVEKRSFKEAVFISPQMEGELVYNWSGTSVSIEFPKKLKDNTTYVVTIGTDVADVNNRNRMAQSFSLTFSTGNEIDKRSIAGTVFADKPSGVMIYAYKLKDDSIDPKKVKPDYITQTGEKGTYKLNGISEGKFRIFAVRDKFKDFLFQAVQDEIGISSRDIAFFKNDTTVENVNFKLTKIDKEPPRIIRAVMTDRSHVLVEFTEDLSRQSVKLKNFSIVDSSKGEKFTFSNVYRKYKINNRIVLINNNSFSGNSNLYLQADDITDLNGNTIKNDYIKLIYSDREDTSKPRLVISEPPSGSSEADYSDQIFRFYFSDYLDSSSAKSGIIFKRDDGMNIPYLINFIDDASFTLKAKIDLLPVKKYKIVIDLHKIKNNNGAAADSNYIYDFTTVNGLNFSGVTGEVKNLETDYPVYIILKGVDENKRTYKQQLSKNRKFVFSRIVSGKYKLWCFIDKDKNGKYSFGSPFPFQPAEKFSYLKYELELKPRWMQTDVVLEFNN